MSPPSPPVERVVGTVHRLAAKPRRPGEHGLPKPEVEVAHVSSQGVDGDYNVYRQEERSGDPSMALLFLPLETVRELNREGWPVRAGDLGENVTTEGVPMEAWREGARIRLGSVEVELSKPCTPCTNLYLLPYVGEARGREFMVALEGRRGWYARVLSPGVVRRGEPIRSPASAG